MKILNILFILVLLCFVSPLKGLGAGGSSGSGLYFLWPLVLETYLIGRANIEVIWSVICDRQVCQKQNTDTTIFGNVKKGDDKYGSLTSANQNCTASRLCILEHLVVVFLLPLFSRGSRRSQTLEPLKGDDVEVDNGNDADASNDIDVYADVFARARKVK